MITIDFGDGFVVSGSLFDPVILDLLRMIRDAGFMPA